MRSSRWAGSIGGICEGAQRLDRTRGESARGREHGEYERFWTKVLGARVSDRIGVAALLRIDEIHHNSAKQQKVSPRGSATKSRAVSGNPRKQVSPSSASTRTSARCSTWQIATRSWRRARWPGRAAPGSCVRRGRGSSIFSGFEPRGFTFVVRECHKLNTPVIQSIPGDHGTHVQLSERVQRQGLDSGDRQGQCAGVARVDVIGNGLAHFRLQPDAPAGRQAPLRR